MAARDAEQRPHDAAVAVEVAFLELVMVAGAAEQFAIAGDADADVIGMGDIDEGALPQLLVGVAEHAAERGVSLQPAAIGGNERHPNAAMVEGAAEALLAFPEAQGGRLRPDGGCGCHGFIL